MVDVELLGLERVGPDRVHVVVRRELAQLEQRLALRRQREQRARFADQQQEALPGNVLAEHVVHDAVDRDVGADHGLEEIAAIGGRDRRDQPALAGRVHVGVRPHDGPGRVVARVRLVIEVEVRDVHARVVHRCGVDPRPDAVERVVRIEVSLDDQRIRERDVPQQRVDGRQPLEPLELGRPFRGPRGPVHGGAAVVAPGRERAARLQAQALPVPRARGRRGERGRRLAPQHLGERRDLAELLFDDRGFVARDARQLLPRDVGQRVDVPAQRPGVAREVDGDEQELDDQERDQRIAHVRAPDPAQQRGFPFGSVAGRAQSGFAAMGSVYLRGDWRRGWDSNPRRA